MNTSRASHGVILLNSLEVGVVKHVSESFIVIKKKEKLAMVDVNARLDSHPEDKQASSDLYTKYIRYQQRFLAHNFKYREYSSLTLPCTGSTRRSNDCRSPVAIEIQRLVLMGAFRSRVNNVEDSASAP